MQGTKRNNWQRVRLSVEAHPFCYIIPWVCTLCTLFFLTLYTQLTAIVLSLTAFAIVTGIGLLLLSAKTDRWWYSKENK